MANNIPKFSNKPRESLRDIPDDLFDPDPSVDAKARLLQRQFNKDPLSLMLLVKRMINESK
jgi:hypothetical protein